MSDAPRRIEHDFLGEMAIPAAAYWGVHTARAAAIVRSCDNLIGGALNEQFVVDVIQGGAGTSTNMNANEVIANRALEHMGRACGDYAALHPNDHVNASQSTKDGYPTALRVAAWFGIEGLLARHRRQHCRRGADVAQALGIMSAAELNALLVPERLTQPVRLVA